jgi:hypothetical protein
MTPYRQEAGRSAGRGSGGRPPAPDRPAAGPRVSHGKQSAR